MTRFQYKFTKRPPFLGEGFLHWKEDGYHHASTPAVDLQSTSALRSDDPWVRLASVIEHARHGDRSHMCSLEPLVRDETIAPTLLRGIMDFLADAGGRRELEILASIMLDGTTYLKIAAVSSAHWAGVLWLIPYMANVLEEDTRLADREAVETAISDLLDPLDGETEFFGKDETSRDYMERVSARVADLAADAETNEVAVFAGELIDMTKVIWQMHAQLRDPSPNRWADFLLLRRRFEAYTGTDCSSFYRNGDFQPLSARVVIEDFIKANPQMRFVPGHRYFFMRDLFGAP